MSQGNETWIRDAVSRGLRERAQLIAAFGGGQKGGRASAFRVLEDRGLVVDVYGPGAVLMAYEGVADPYLNGPAACGAALEGLTPLGVKAVYFKPFPRDRSKMGGDMPPEITAATPAAGETLPETVTIDENGYKLEIRLYDGWSTGLFLDQRQNRLWVAEWCASHPDASVLNTFAYTCAFSVAAAVGGKAGGGGAREEAGEQAGGVAVGREHAGGSGGGRRGPATTSVDVSPRYLDWGKRNFAINALDPADPRHRFARMDTFEFFAYARRKALNYDLIILDPPSFASGNKKKGIRPWSSLADYPRLVGEARALLNPGGTIFASTNTQELCRGNGLRLEQEILRGLGRKPRWVPLPPPPEDFPDDRGRFAARAFVP